MCMNQDCFKDLDRLRSRFAQQLAVTTTHGKSSKAKRGQKLFKVSAVAPEKVQM